MKNLAEEVQIALWEALAHGDDDHRQWLKEAITAFFSGTPIPAPYGSGNKEALIAQLQADNLVLLNALAKYQSVE